MKFFSVNRKTLISIFLLTLMVSSTTLATKSIRSEEGSSGSFHNLEFPHYPSDIVRAIPFKVVFVGYDKEILNLTFVSQRLSMRYWHVFSSGSVRYIIKFNVTHANKSLESEITQYINRIKKNDTTSDLLEDKLEEQLEKVKSGVLGVRMKVFENTVKGYSIDAVALENKLATLSPNTNDTFYLYVLNMSMLDDQNEGIEHWYTVDIKDADSNRTRDFWRLEWDNSLNTPVKFPFAGFNMRHRVLFIDPTAYNWYLNWTRIWWGDVPETIDKAMYWRDLDHFIRGLNLSDEENITAINTYIVSWIEDFLDDLVLYASSLQLYSGSLYTDSASVQINIINTRPDIVSTNKYKWTVSKEKILVALRQIYPNINVTFKINFADLSSYPEISEILEENIYRQDSGWTYYDGVSIYSELNKLKSKYFNLTLAKRNLVGWIFILYDASMVVMNREFTGLGGNGHILIMMEAKRLLGEHLNEPRQGFSLVIIHELGHSLGFLHTFHEASYASDFAFDVMGYYPGSWNYSRIRIETIHREINDDLLLNLYSRMNSLIKNITARNDSYRFEDKVLEIDWKLHQIDKLQNTTHYNEAFEEIQNVLKDIASLKDMMEGKMEEQPQPPSGLQTQQMLLVASLIIIVAAIIVVLFFFKRRK